MIVFFFTHVSHLQVQTLHVVPKRAETEQVQRLTSFIDLTQLIIAAVKRYPIRKTGI